MPYSTAGLLSDFYEIKKDFKFSQLSKTFVIKQDWSKYGVAGVVWEAVSFYNFINSVLKILFELVFK